MEQKKVSLQFLMEAEYIKCKNDPEYFIAKYVYIQTTKGGRSLFGLYIFQKKLLALIRRHPRLCILKSRQLGITTLAAAYAVWLYMFVPDSSILCMAPTGATAKQIIEKFKFALDNMKPWLLDKTNSNPVTFNSTNVVGSNGSKIAALSGNPDAARGRTANLLIFDEMAFVERDQEVFAAASQTLATGGSMIMLSTPNGNSNLFHQTYTDAENGEGEFIPVKLPWYVHPDRDQAWRDKADREMGKRLAGQECNCDFVTSGNTYFESEDMEWVKGSIEDPVTMEQKENSFWIWKYPEECGNCVVIVDTSVGDYQGGDASTVQVIDLATFSQVAEYKGDKDPKALSEFSIQVALRWNKALLVVENTGVGESTCNYIKNSDVRYPNIYWSAKGNTADTSQYMTEYMDEDKMRLGFTMSTATRTPVLSCLRMYINQKQFKIRSRRTYNEMTVFVWKGSRPEAKRGYHDDLIMPLAIGAYLYDSALTHASTSKDLTIATLNSYKRTGYYNMHRDPIFNQNPLTMLNPHTGEIEDISWVLSGRG